MTKTSIELAQLKLRKIERKLLVNLVSWYEKHPDIEPYINIRPMHNSVKPKKSWSEMVLKKTTKNKKEAPKVNKTENDIKSIVVKIDENVKDGKHDNLIESSIPKPQCDESENVTPQSKQIDVEVVKQVVSVNPQFANKIQQCTIISDKISSDNVTSTSSKLDEIKLIKVELNNGESCDKLPNSIQLTKKQDEPHKLSLGFTSNDKLIKETTKIDEETIKIDSKTFVDNLSLTKFQKRVITVETFGEIVVDLTRSELLYLYEKIPQKTKLCIGLLEVLDENTRTVRATGETDSIFFDEENEDTDCGDGEFD